jgi:asparagine synthase (glutamine-hydrolysing)
LSIPIHFRNHNNFNRPEKYLLRESFDINNFVSYDGKQILPDEILWRKKEAFSDGVSSKGRSLFEILQEFIAIDYNETTGLETYKPCIELEKEYYKTLFEKEFPNCQHILPYFWMPKYTNATDPSARTLEFYNNPK